MFRVRNYRFEWMKDCYARADHETLILHYCTQCKIQYSHATTTKNGIET
jgi:hypothetical protein